MFAHESVSREDLIMPLPENWDGVFYGPESQGELLFDVEPADLAAMFAERPDGPFLAAGGAIDLALNRELDRAGRLADEASRVWPAEPWHLHPGISLMSVILRDTVSAGERGAADTAINDTIASFFTGGFILRVLDPALNGGTADPSWRGVFNPDATLLTGDLSAFVAGLPDNDEAVILVIQAMLDLALNQNATLSSGMTAAAEDKLNGINPTTTSLLRVALGASTLIYTAAKNRAPASVTDPAMRGFVSLLRHAID